MRTFKSILLAGAMLLAIPAFFSSCQEDGTQLKYNVEVTVTNDFSKVVEAINNGTLKNEQAIAQLTAAIDKMNADQQTKLQAIKDVLNSVNATIDAKLAAIEAAMTAQTLSLEGKLALIEDAMKAQTLTLEKKCDALVAAIKGLPDYTAKLAAIETAIKALPNYEEQLKALNTLIEAQNSKLDDQIAALEGIMNAIPDYSNKLSAIENAIKAMPDHNAAINGIKDEIANLVKEVKDGNKSKADALAEIAKKLEELKAAGGGDSGTSKMEYVDLGLSVKWAKCNLGANKPSEIGHLYAWGETDPYVENSTIMHTDKEWAEYEFVKPGYNTRFGINKYQVEDGREEGIWYPNNWDNKKTLEPQDDAATVNLGTPWRMPDAKELTELWRNCNWSVSKLDGKDVLVGESMKNGNIIIFSIDDPHAGGWFGVPSRELSIYTSSFYYLYFEASKPQEGMKGYINRIMCMPIRAVQ